MQTITLAKGWGRYKAGQKLAVLGRGAEWQANAVDEQRAAQLAKDGFVAAEKAPEPKRQAAKGKEA